MFIISFLNTEFFFQTHTKHGQSVLCTIVFNPLSNSNVHSESKQSQQKFEIVNPLFKDLRILLGDELFLYRKPLSHRSNITSLSLQHPEFNDKSTDELHSLITTCHAISNRHSLIILLVRLKFHLECFFTRAAVLWSKMPRGCFPEDYILNHKQF